MSSCISPVRLRVYIDGFNLYHAIDDIGKNELKWIDLRTLAKSFLRSGEILDKVIFFTAVLMWNADKKQRHVNYIRALRAVGVEVVESSFKKGSRYCYEEQKYCKNREEKQTDVAIAVALISDAYEDNFDRALLITADSDQIPVADMMAQRFSHKQLSLAAPPNRLSAARDLGNRIADRREIKEGRLRTCMLPDNVYDESGRKVASIPAVYLSRSRG